MVGREQQRPLPTRCFERNKLLGGDEWSTRRKGVDEHEQRMICSCLHGIKNQCQNRVGRYMSRVGLPSTTTLALISYPPEGKSLHTTYCILPTSCGKFIARNASGISAPNQQPGEPPKTTSATASTSKPLLTEEHFRCSVIFVPARPTSLRS
ncbi:hypothetical protein BC835DRAFT_575281 [Cytidiella melzeri]|nr:hypothetical protein BC835DRAFT_575281 [Cytidiella melzeri]